MSVALRVVLLAADPQRRPVLEGMLTEAGHRVVAPDEAADACLLDLALSAPPPAPRVGPAPLLVLTDQAEPASDRAIPGVIRRLSGARQVDAALRAVAAGLLVRDRASVGPAGFAASTDELPAEKLTPREMEILAAVGEGLSNKAVARRLGISAHTVKFHLEAIFAKLEAGSRAEAVVKRLRRGLIEL